MESSLTIVDRDLRGHNGPGPEGGALVPVSPAEIPENANQEDDARDPSPPVPPSAVLPISTGLRAAVWPHEEDGARCVELVQRHDDFSMGSRKQMVF